MSDSRLPNPFPDPYAHEPERPSTVNIRTDCPYTAEPDTQELLAAGYITPNELHYVRNHLPAPVLKAEDYTLTIEGPGVGQPRQQQQQHGVEAQLADLNVGFGGSGNQSKPGLDQAASAAAEAAVVGSAAYNEPAGTGLLCQEANISRAAAAAGSNHLSSNSSSRVGKVELQLSDLQQQFAQHTVVATLQCAGNRRNDMRRFKEVNYSAGCLQYILVVPATIFCACQAAHHSVNVGAHMKAHVVLSTLDSFKVYVQHLSHL